jgi:endogenous inhibitor of DNA gyrase (YacG/DUF329 family)
MNEHRDPQRFRKQCPHCDREVAWPETKTYPFCSERCRLIDLGAWASGDYRVPGEPASEEDLRPWVPTDDETVE